jgi:simple sugar transport system ATP-binding protein
MENISKNYGAVEALRDVSIHVDRHEVLGLLGDNGAGKSTLIKVLAGVHPPTKGQVYFDGKPVVLKSPADARRIGIETVHQALSLVDIMTISRNFYLGREPTRKIGPFTFLDRRKMDRECSDVVSHIGVRVRDPNEYVSLLSGGERQAISIGRAMHFGAKVLILDEPMTALSIKEVRIIFKEIEQARDTGAAIIFITHNVHHVYPIADRFTILDRGNKIGDLSKDQVSPKDLMEVIATGDITSRVSGDG